MDGERRYSFKVAELTFEVAAPGCYDIGRLLPSFASFRVEEADPQLFSFTVRPEPVEVPTGAEKLVEDDNDMGHTILSRTPDGDYCLELSYDESPLPGKSPCGNNGGIFIAPPDFSRVSAHVAAGAPDCGSILSSMIRIAFAQAVLMRDGISIHASAVAKDGRAFLFLGKSGTGKSTHSRLWLKNIPETHLLNDDNPAIRLIGGKAIAFGTPWSGKTPCYRNKSYPIGGIVRIVRGKENVFTEKKDVAAFMAILPSCSAVHSDAVLQSHLYDTIADLAVKVPVGELECLPDDAAAIVCYNQLKSLIK